MVVTISIESHEGPELVCSCQLLLTIWVQLLLLNHLRCAMAKKHTTAKLSVICLLFLIITVVYQLSDEREQHWELL